MTLVLGLLLQSRSLIVPTLRFCINLTEGDGDLGGLKDHPIEDTGAKRTSEAPVGTSEERGRSPRDKKQNLEKVFKALENRGQGPNKETKGLHKGTKSRKERKPEDNQLRKGVQDLRKWFERKDLALEKEPACQNLKTETEKGK